jgi:hypothetical protein
LATAANSEWQELEGIGSMETETRQTAETQGSSLLQTNPFHDLGDPNSTEAE